MPGLCGREASVKLLLMMFAMLVAIPSAVIGVLAAYVWLGLMAGFESGRKIFD